MRAIYPNDIAWNLPIDVRRFRPTIGNRFLNWLRNENFRHWTAWSRGELIGSATWEPNPLGGDNLWLAPSPEHEDEAVRALLMHSRQQMYYQHMISVNYPARRAALAFEQSGFQAHNTLVWMEIRFDK